MLSRILSLLRGRPLVIEGTGALPEGQSKKVAVGDPLAGGTEIVLARVDGTLHALDVICPHEGGRFVDGPLSEGRLVRCPLHEYRFDPKTGRAVGAACSNARTYRVRERDGKSEVWV